MSGREIGTVAGALIVGYLTAGTGLAAYGTAIGGIAGGALGGALDKGPNTQGPRLEDLKVAGSTYGVGIPVLYGTERLAGNVIWSTDKLEIPTTTSAGKGGGASNTSYKYYVHMSIALCETPRDGSQVSIIQIFQDGKLIWDVHSGIPISSALATSADPYGSFVLWQGDEAQLPDPIEESWLGVGNVPAYRGIVRVRMIAIECPGGRVPQFSFVCSAGATTTTVGSTVATVPGYASNSGGSIVGFNTSQFDISHISGGAILYRTMRDANSLDREKSLGAPLGNCQGGWSLQSAWASYTSATNTFTITSTTGSASVGAPIDVSNGPMISFDTLGGNYCGVSIVTPYNWFVLGAGGQSWTGTFSGSDVCTAMCTNGTTAYFIRQGASNDLVTVNIATGSVASIALPSGFGTTQHSHVMLDGGTDLYVYSTSAKSLWRRVNGAWALWMTGLPAWNYTDSVGVSGGLLYGCARGIGSDAVVSIWRRAYVPGVAKASSIFADQFQRAGEARYDLSAVPDADTVYGYKISTPASARANVDVLLNVFGYYIVDEDGLIKVKRYQDIASVATVTYDELGQAEDGAVPGDAMPLARTQTTDLARSITASYINPSFDFQTSSEKVVRMATTATADQSMQLAVAIAPGQAKNAAQMALDMMYRSQNTRTLKVSRKFAFVSPGDGVTVEYPKGTLQLWLVLSATDTGVVCEWSVVPGDASLFTHTAVGSQGYTAQAVSPLPPQTNMTVLDVPIMQDSDNNGGLYVSGEGYSPGGWPGFTLEMGDDDTNLTDRGTVTTPCPTGFAESALGPWTPNMLDGKNSVVVNMGSDTLNSTTEALLMTSRANLAAIGVDGRWEFVQFMTASSLGGGRFLIYGLLRGQFGTERFAGTHQANDTFVLITKAGMLRPNMDVGSIGQVKSYRGVTLNRSINSTISQRFANHAFGLLPYSPWNAAKSVDASNNQTLTWERRSRLSTNSLRGNVPLGEATEHYSIGFYTSNTFATLAGTLTSATKTLTLTSAQQTAFGLTPGGTLYVHISQVSDSIGVGAPLEVSL